MCHLPRPQPCISPQPNSHYLSVMVHCSADRRDANLEFLRISSVMYPGTKHCLWLRDQENLAFSDRPQHKSFVNLVVGENLNKFSS
jgi:hypothetical protein